MLCSVVEPRFQRTIMLCAVKSVAFSGPECTAPRLNSRRRQQQLRRSNKHNTSVAKAMEVLWKLGCCLQIEVGIVQKHNITYNLLHRHLAFSSFDASSGECQCMSWGGAVVRALASHQCVLGSIPGPGVTCELSLLLVLALAPRVFLRVLWFSSLLNPLTPVPPVTARNCP